MNKRLQRTMRFRAVLVGLFVALSAALLAGSGVALADDGPHDMAFSTTTDVCAACHRTHSASGTRLIRSSDTLALCATCHGGTGADTDVMDGVFMPSGKGLKGGGFNTALMDVSVSGTPVSASTTSAHSVNGTSGMAWGGGAISPSASYGTDVALECINCHNPHGNGQYRLLRRTPNAGYGTTSIAIPDESSKQYEVAYAITNYKDTSYVPADISQWCAQCHTRYLAESGSGSTDSGDGAFQYRHMTSDLSGGCLKCHVAHGTAATMQTNSGQVPWPDGASGGGAADSRLLNVSNRGVCAQCHVSNGQVVGGCNGCHEAPPATGAHLAHAGTNSVGYGLTGSRATATSYQYGCGECHPTDSARHMNGTVDVQLSSAGAPSTSLKAKNGSSAAYTSGSCAQVYCHSGEQVTSGLVGEPLRDGSNQLILDSRLNLTYASYTVTKSRSFQTTPAWNGGHISSCTGCHAFPLTTTYPSVRAGVGDSHQWIDDYGYGDLHAWNMASDPLPCRSCHYGEVTQAGTWSRNGMDVTSYGNVVLASRTSHANGQANVVFDTVNSVSYGTTSHSLASASYNQAENSCANVSCHKFQTYVQWGSPYRWWNSPECDLCHRMSLPKPGPLGVPSGTLADMTHSPQNLAGKECITCHQSWHRPR